MSKAKSMGLYAADEKWKVESDLRTLQDAEQIRKDPKRLAKAQRLASEKLEELALVKAETSRKD